MDFKKVMSKIIVSTNYAKIEQMSDFAVNISAFLLFLSPGKTIEQSCIQHPTLLDVNVEIVAKHHPTLLDETSHRCKLVLNLI